MHVDSKKIQIIMARKCMNKKCFAEKAGITPLTISKVLSGRNARADTVGLMAQALGVDPSEIIKEE